MTFKTATLAVLIGISAMSIRAITIQTDLEPTDFFFGPPHEGSHVDFGYSVRASGRRLLIGAPAYGQDDQGAIFVFGQNGQLETMFGGTEKEGLGKRFSVSGSLVAIRRRGSVEVRDVQTRELVGQVIDSNGGSAVTLLDDLLVVSEESADGQTGRVRFFVLDPNAVTNGDEVGTGMWVEQETMLTGMSPSGRFGHMTALNNDGSRLAVAAPNTVVDGDNKRGAVMVYENTNGNWVQLGQTLTGVAANDNFGFAMAFSGDGNTLIVGAPGSNGEGTFRGEVSAFRFLSDTTGWMQVGGTISGGMDRDRLGRTLAMNNDGSRFVVSSYLHNGQSGQLRVFDLNPTIDEYVETFQYVGETKKLRLGFGLDSVAMLADGLRFYAGATWGGGEGSYSGKVEVFDLPDAAVFSPIPSHTPSMAPTQAPSFAPTVLTTSPTITPTMVPSSEPTFAPTESPTLIPTGVPTMMPSLSPTAATNMPSELPSDYPSVVPSATPSSTPSLEASSFPSASPSMMPSNGPSGLPSLAPSIAPTTMSPTTTTPTTVPSNGPSNFPSQTPTVMDSIAPTVVQSNSPSMTPTVADSTSPTVTVSSSPSQTVESTAPTTDVVSGGPSQNPSETPTSSPSAPPSSLPRLSDGLRGSSTTDPSSSGHSIRSVAIGFIAVVVGTAFLMV